MKKFISLVCCLIMAVSSLAFVGCGKKVESGSGGSGKGPEKTKIYVELKSGGTGTQWLVDAGKRFSSLKQETEYEEGKKGVEIIPMPSDNPSIKNAETSGVAIFDLMGEVNIESAARSGKVLCIDDVITEKSDYRNGIAISPLEKISEDQRSRYMYNGHYYGGPTCEYYPTINYDKNLFDKYNLYFASAEEIEADDDYLVVHESDILDEYYYFVPDKKAEKSCGPDGKYGTSDDGLPSSLYELIALCEYMKTKTIYPFNFTGGYKYYSNFMLSAIYTALQGYEGARNNYTFSGESEIVIGFEDEYLFPGLDDNGKPISTIKKPITKVVDITEENGYYTTWEVEKYYAEAFMDLCVKQSWFGPSVTNNDDQKATMFNFVFSDFNGSDKIAMHIDGSYWYNEATEGEDYFQLLEDSKYLMAGMTEPRDVRVMPLPVNFSETVVEGEGKSQTLLEMNYGMLVLNKNLESNPGLMQASKEFLQFLYTDAELSAYTASTSILRSMEYDLTSDDASAISSYGKNLINLVSKEGKVVYFAGDNATFKANTAALQQSWTNAVFAVSGVAPSFYEAIAIYKKDGLKTVEDIFTKQTISKSVWESMYKGGKSVTSIDGLVSLIG